MKKLILALTLGLFIISPLLAMEDQEPNINGVRKSTVLHLLMLRSTPWNEIYNQGFTPEDVARQWYINSYDGTRYYPMQSRYLERTRYPLELSQELIELLDDIQVRCNRIVSLFYDFHANIDQISAISDVLSENGNGFNDENILTSYLAIKRRNRWWHLNYLVRGLNAGESYYEICENKRRLSSTPELILGYPNVSIMAEFTAQDYMDGRYLVENGYNSLEETLLTHGNNSQDGQLEQLRQNQQRLEDENAQQRRENEELNRRAQELQRSLSLTRIKIATSIQA